MKADMFDELSNSELVDLIQTRLERLREMAVMGRPTDNYLRVLSVEKVWEELKKRFQDEKKKGD